MLDLTAADLLERPEVLQTCGHVARKIAWHDRWRELVEVEDVEQDARELVAGTQAQLTRECLAGVDGKTLGTLHHRLHDRLTDRYATTERRARRTTSADVRYDDTADGYTLPFAGPTLAEPVETYSPALVAELVPGIWDTDGAWPLTIQNAPDAGQPRSAPNYSTSGTYWACRADVSLAWRRAPLTQAERQVVFLVLGLDWTHDAAAHLLGVHQSNVTRRLASAMSKLVEKINALAAHEIHGPPGNVLSGSGHDSAVLRDSQPSPSAGAPGACRTARLDASRVDSPRPRCPSGEASPQHAA